MACDHNCSECGESCSERSGGIQKERLHELSRVKKVIGVISGTYDGGQNLNLAVPIENVYRLLESEMEVK